MLAGELDGVMRKLDRMTRGGKEVGCVSKWGDAVLRVNRNRTWYVSAK